MRWIFVGVIALNLLYFGWRLAAPEEGRATVQVAPQAAREFPAPLTLLSEKGSVPATAAQPPQPELQGCPAVGPLSSDADAKRVATSLAAAGVAATMRKIDMRDAVVFWVYLPAYGGRTQALRKLRELHSKGIDSFVVSEGPDTNAISLGSFTSRASALGVQSRLRSAGYGAELREQTRDVEQMWVVLKSPSAQGYLEYLPSDLRDKVRQERLACN